MTFHKTDLDIWGYSISRKTLSNSQINTVFSCNWFGNYTVNCTAELHGNTYIFMRSDLFTFDSFFAELFYTEKCHVRNLKIMDKLFYRPMLKDGSISQEFTKSLFPNLETMIQLHSK